MTEKFLCAQISAMHIRAGDDGAALRQLRRALSQARDSRVDAILLTGDLANDERADEYALLADALVDPPAPTFLLPGNHDDRELIRRTFASRHPYLPRSGPLSFVLDQFALRIVMVDQTAPGETHGVLTEAQAAWLDAELSTVRMLATIEMMRCLIMKSVLMVAHNCREQMYYASD